jgi:hypothetical protein
MCASCSSIVYLYYRYFGLPNQSDLFPLTFFTGKIDMLCLFGTTAHTKLSLSFSRNPVICDCLDFVIYSLVHSFPHVSILEDLFCEWPIEHRGDMVHTPYFPRLMKCDNGICVMQFFDETAM